MKRGAEKQISKDDRSDDETQDENLQVGFRKADDSVLATRKIRGLPKRASVASIPPPAVQTGAIEMPRFNGFSGFSGSNSFSALSSTTTFTPTATTNIFSPSSSSSSNTATNTAKSLTSLLASSPNPPGSSPESPFSKPSTVTSVFASAPAATSSSASSTQKDSTTDSAELKYYTSLRGLNESLRTVIGNAIDADPFVDITVFLERYKSVRADIQKDFDGKTTPSTTSSATSTPAPVTKTFSVPTLSSGGFTFAGVKTAFSTDTKPSATTSPASGFTPTLPVPSGGFTFGGKPVDLKPSDSKPPSIFGAPLRTSRKPDTPVTSLPFPFTSKSSEEKDAISIFGNKSSEDKKDLALATTSTSLTTTNVAPKSGSSSWLSKPDSSSKLAIGDKDKPDEKHKLLTFGSSTTSTPATSITFGTTSTSSVGTVAPALRTSSDAPSSRFAGFGGFGKPSTTATPSFGFTPALTAPPTPLAITPSGSSVGTDAASNMSGDAAADDVPKKNMAESFALNADNKHDQEGAGEEDEETLHSVKLKAYVLKDDKGAKNWVEMGYGVLRIKKHKETGSRRVLLRSSSTGQILINFTFHSALKPAQKAKNVTFLGHDAEGNSKMYTLKTQTEAQAKQLKDAFDKEMEAKEGST